MTKLEEYNYKRDFTRTAEPEGKLADDMTGLRFVVQHHIARKGHYDLRLELDGVLLSWAVPKGPSYNPQEKRLAVRVEDHPLDYRNFEGTIPQGEYGGGTVMLWDEGYWQPYAGGADEGLHSGILKFVLEGVRLKGKWALIKLRGKTDETKDNWLLIKEKDEYAGDSTGISQYSTSIRSGRTMQEIAAGVAGKTTQNPFTKVKVQLAKLAAKVPAGDEWIYELKYDGYRLIAFVEDNNVRLITRNSNDYTSRFQPIAASLIEWTAGRAMVLDGEMVVTDTVGKTDFQALQNYMRSPRTQNLIFVIFDLLALDGIDQRNLPLIKRKTMLEKLMQNAPQNLWYSRHVCGNGEESFTAACRMGMEGIIGKRSGSFYHGFRNGDWIKLKCDNRQEFVIGGYTLSAKRKSGVSSLLLGVYEGEELNYAGRAGTGISQAMMQELEKKFKPLTQVDSPFKTSPRTKPNEKLTWLEPRLVAEIKFAEWTADNLLRQASFIGLREDKKPQDVQWEGLNTSPATNTLEANKGKDMPKEKPITANDLVVAGIKITHPDKILFEERNITKAEVVLYYEKMAEHMLPYVSRRILSIVRCPKGVTEKCFYKKHPAKKSQGVVTIPVLTSDGSSEEYFYLEDMVGLIAEAQMGTLEFHVWGSRIDELEKPDYMVFDLDPDEGMDLAIVRQGVKDLKSVLTELTLVSYLKTSGGKGYHVVVPFKPAADWERFYDFAKGVAAVMEQGWPERYTSNSRKVQRKGKIFIDWLRNGRGATSIAPYSIRARAGAQVSMPISWDELDIIAPDGINMENALQRINGADPWSDFFKNEQILK